MKLRKLLPLLLGLLLVPSCTDNFEFGENNNNQNENNNNQGNENQSQEDEEDDIEYTYNYYDDSDSFTSGAVKLSFNSAGNYKYLKGIDGKKVALKGFMFSASPVDGSFIFLSNMPYQSCPFCALNTSELSNCYEIYPKKNEKFSYTESAIVIVGTLKVAPSKTDLFTDKYEYEFLSKIEDAEYKILKDSDQDGDFTLRNKFANSTLLTDLYEMLNYVNFVCKWSTYYIPSYENSKGETVQGFYLYPDEALYYITTDDAQWNYGYVDGYFDGFITRINKLADTGFETLIQIVQKCKETAEYAISELEKENYSCTLQTYTLPNEETSTTDYIYEMNDKTLANKPEELYNEFSYWLTGFEM